jgi:hypothetical protein
MTTTYKPKLTASFLSAADEYTTQHAKALSLIESLRAMIQDLPSAESEKIHWGHVGNIGYVNVNLNEMIRFVESIQAVREIQKHKGQIESST